MLSNGHTSEPPAAPAGTQQPDPPPGPRIRYAGTRPPGETGAPSRAWVNRADGARVDLVLDPPTPDAPDEWHARPATDAPLYVGPADELCVDRCYPGQSVVYDRVWRADQQTDAPPHPDAPGRP